MRWVCAAWVDARPDRAEAQLSWWAVRLDERTNARGCVMEICMGGRSSEAADGAGAGAGSRPAEHGPPPGPAHVLGGLVAPLQQVRRLRRQVLVERLARRPAVSSMAAACVRACARVCAAARARACAYRLAWAGRGVQPAARPRVRGGERCHAQWTVRSKEGAASTHARARARATRVR